MVDKLKMAFVIATKDRTEDLCRALESLSIQDMPAEQIIVVDGGDVSVEKVVLSFPTLNIQYLTCRPPSAARQRNVGIRAVGRDVSLIGFLDDDIVLEPSALSNMMAFWRNAEADIGGAAFNLINRPTLFAGSLKKLPLTERLGFYSPRGGRVLDSGFHTMIDFVEEDTVVQWMPTTAVVYRREILVNEVLDEWFKGYSYLEDLEFSYRIGKKYRLVVVSKARYSHFPGAFGRGNPVEFGRREVLNRVYFVRKNRELSLPKCYLALFLRILINIAQAICEFRMELLKRAWGDILGIASSVFLR